MIKLTAKVTYKWVTNEWPRRYKQRTEEMTIPTDAYGHVLESSLSTKITILLKRSDSKFRSLVWHRLHWESQT